MILDKLSFILSLTKGSKNNSNSYSIDNQVNSESENPVQNKAIYNFVNSSVASNTAYFKGTYRNMAELEAVINVTNNDYAFVVSVDDNGNTVYNRYKYSDNKWMFEYSLNNSSFTANQWETINSGITYADIHNLQTAKVDKEPGKGLSANDFTDDDKEKLLSLKNYEDAGIRSETALNRSTLGYQRKNLLKNTAVSGTANGIPYTVNADGSVVFGTGTTTNICYIYIGEFSFKAGISYTMSGAPDDGTTETRLSLINDSGGEMSAAYQDIGKGTTFSFESDVTYRVRARIAGSGATISETIAFYPMLRYAEIIDDTYEPYKPSVEERLAALEAAVLGGGT